MAEKKSVLIIDDHAILREGLKSVIARSGEFRVVGEAADMAEGLRKAKELKPDAVTLDLSLPDGSGIELIRSLQNLSRRPAVLVVTMHSNIAYITEAFRAGAKGFVVKESAADKLLRGLEAVVEDREYLDSAVSPEVIKNLVRNSEKKSGIEDESYESLSPREREILKMLAEGMSAKQIAKTIFISPKTVENHRAHIMKKLGFHSALKLVHYAARIGLIDPKSWTEE